LPKEISSRIEQSQDYRLSSAEALPRTAGGGLFSPVVLDPLADKPARGRPIGHPKNAESGASYKQPKFIAAGVLKRAIRELNERADLTFRYEPIKEARKLVGWAFRAIPNTPTNAISWSSGG
jgi:hypothetical protein